MIARAEQFRKAEINNSQRMAMNWGAMTAGASQGRDVT
jgi:hypothetical protein